jgi:hypothetical protein
MQVLQQEQALPRGVLGKFETFLCSMQSDMHRDIGRLSDSVLRKLIQIF